MSVLSLHPIFSGYRLVAPFTWSLDRIAKTYTLQSSSVTFLDNRFYLFFLSINFVSSWLAVDKNSDFSLFFSHTTELPFAFLNFSSPLFFLFVF